LSGFFLVGGVVWTLLLGIWAYRLSAHDLYAEKLWVWLWIAVRLLLRFGLGLALLWAVGAVLSPPEAAYRVLIVEAALPEAWEKADSLLRQRYAGIKTGVLAVKGAQAFWVLPPTDDPTLFRWLREIRPSSSTPEKEPPSAPRYLTPLSPYLPVVRQIVWIGPQIHPPRVFQCGYPPPSSKNPLRDPNSLSFSWGMRFPASLGRWPYELYPAAGFAP
jgi:hypothetical protein